MLPAMSPTVRRRLTALAVLTFVIVVIVIGSQAREALGIDLNVGSVRRFAEGLGPLGPVLFIGLVAFRSFLALPSQVVLIAAGLCFGTLVGTLVGATGLMLSGLMLFALARYAGQTAIEKQFGRRFGGLLQASGRRAGAFALALGTGYPVSPLSPIHAAAGLTPMPLLLFMLGAFAGGLIRASIFALFGSAITQMSATSLLVASVPFALALVAPLAHPRGRLWLRQIFDRVESADPAPATASADPE